MFHKRIKRIIAALSLAVAAHNTAQSKNLFQKKLIHKSFQLFASISEHDITMTYINLTGIENLIIVFPVSTIQFLVKYARWHIEYQPSLK